MNLKEMWSGVWEGLERGKGKKHVKYNQKSKN